MGLSAQPVLAHEVSIAGMLLLPLQPLRRVSKTITPRELARGSLKHRPKRVRCGAAAGPSRRAAALCTPRLPALALRLVRGAA